MFVNPHVTFIMLSLCYAQCPSYLLHIIFLFLGLLQHYAKYDAHTIVTLEKLLGVGSFGTIVGHLAHC
jgi:hypothetical protein